MAAAKPKTPAGAKKHVGPLPLWGWGVVLGGGLLLGLYLRSKLSASSASGGGAVPAATGSAGVPVASGGSSDTSGGAVGASQAAASSGLDPFTEQLLAAQTDALTSGFVSAVNSVTTLGGAALYSGTQAQQQSFDFASNVFGSALDFLNTHYAAPAPVPSPTVIVTPTVTTTPTVPAGGGGGGTVVSPYHSVSATTSAPTPLQVVTAHPQSAVDYTTAPSGSPRGHGAVTG